MSSLRERILSREVLAGTWLNLGSPWSAEIAALAGFAWVLIDREHGGGDEKDMALQILGAESGGAAPVVRVAGLLPAEMKRALDHGAAGVMVPQVNDAREAAAAVAAVRIPPEGHRGAASSTRSSRYGFGYRHYLETANSTLVTMVQIESVDGLRHCAEIAATDGVDVLFVGPTDLSTSLGLAEVGEGDEFLEALRAIERAARAAGKAAGILARSQSQAERYVELGYTVVSIESDRGLLAKGFRAAAEEFRARTGAKVGAR